MKVWHGWLFGLLTATAVSLALYVAGVDLNPQHSALAFWLGAAGTSVGSLAGWVAEWQARREHERAAREARAVLARARDLERGEDAA